MKIVSIYVRRYRSIASAALTGCGGLNILIGKNNAGKSNLLSAIETTLKHLEQGIIAGVWPTSRVKDEFTDRDASQPMQIGVEFEMTAEVRKALQERLRVEAPHLDKAVDQLAESTILSVVLAGVARPYSFLYVQRIGAGTIHAGADSLELGGINLLSVQTPVAAELFEIQQTISQLRHEQDLVGRLLRNRRAIETSFAGDAPRGYWTYELREHGRPDVIRKMEQRLRGAGTAEEAFSILGGLLESDRVEIENLSKRQTAGAISAFAGETKMPPAYGEWLLKQCGGVPMLHFRENKQRIGREEAETLLQLKVRRGGPARLDDIQQTIRSLLGVHVDAFQADGESRSAEMDVDEFLVEANGAGIREALRIILDLELKHPELVLIEEPEVHLHPGLARVLAGYLRRRSNQIQMFVTTHSTEFVDSVTFQNAYLVSRDGKKRTVIQRVTADDEALRIPAELGLRLSTVFMFDRLVFVEGPSDEAVLRRLATTLGVDLTRHNVGFVHMGGVRNFAHYAADATLDLLSRRRISTLFIVDRDERDDTEVKRMVEKLGDRADLVVLKRREIENYLLDCKAIASFILEKKVSVGLEASLSSDEVRRAMTTAIEKLKPEVVRLRLERKLLTPVFLHTRSHNGTIQERLHAAVEQLTARGASIEREQREIAEWLDREWTTESVALVPGSSVLGEVMKSFGVAFSKANGDSERLAGLIEPHQVPHELTELINKLSD